MSKGNTTTVTHPDGTKSTRTSKSMIYTHAVEVKITRFADKMIEVAEGALEVSREWLVEAAAKGNIHNVTIYENRIAEREARLADLRTKAGASWVEYGVWQWSQSAVNATKGLKKATFISNLDGSTHTARVVEVDK